MHGHPALEQVLSASRAAARREGSEQAGHNGAARLFVWIERARQRRQLTELSDRSLKDIGVSRHEALHEASKRFWQE